MSKNMMEFSFYPVIHEQAVAWGDMDAFGHVNNVMYYRYIESARIYYMQSLDIFSKDIYTVVASNQCKYLRPVFYPDTLKIAVRIEELRKSGFRMVYQLWSVQQNQLVATAEAVIVVVDKHDLKKTLIPEYIKNKIIEIENNVNHPIVFSE